MTNNPIKRAYLELNVAVLLFGFTAILGDLIQLQETVMVWWRLLFTCLSLLFFKAVWREVRHISRKECLQLMGIGLLVSIHWILFYGSIKYSNASTSLICLSTTAFLVSLIEPVVMRHPFRWLDVGLGLLVVPGIALVANGTAPDKLLGLWLGLGSALVAALFSVLNRQAMLKYQTSAFTMTFIELGAGFLFISLLLPFYFDLFPDAVMMPPTWKDVFYLLALSLLCTTFAYVLAFNSLKHLSAFASTLTVNLEPIYGVLMAIFILKEHQQMNAQFYVGMCMILAIVLSYPLLSKYLNKKTLDNGK